MPIGRDAAMVCGVIDTGSNILDRVRVGDCMRAGIFSCDPEASLHELAQTMSSLRVHALLLRATPPQAPVLLSDLDVMAGMALGGRRRARDLVAGRSVTVSRLRPLRDATQLMVEHGASHLIVIDEANAHPVGVLSTTDILQAYAATDQPDS